MGVVTKLKPTRDPERFRLDNRAAERRLETIFSDLRRIVDLSNTLGSRADAAEMTLEARPNSTTGTGDKVLLLAGSRQVRGKRAQVVEPPFAPFDAWTIQITFASPFPTPPVVTVTPIINADEVVTARVRDLTASGFFAVLSCPVAQTSMQFGWQAWGDA
ncbi:hypothetical protein [Deinococcus sp. Leaf326]|uniref:hypothetical protein n=1 Tax=Deinococcus sp. Leaf326 TaxID=1736338 RepID=UPI0006FCAAC2|nr:hypothetical protein [Deinococcus sp. Leaf326]KQR22863.1 hypothetical protein ASF71_06770 [Deinococcus sp. Leaf326]